MGGALQCPCTCGLGKTRCNLRRYFIRICLSTEEVSRPYFWQDCLCFSSRRLNAGECAPCVQYWVAAHDPQHKRVCLSNTPFQHITAYADQCLPRSSPLRNSFYRLSFLLPGKESGSHRENTATVKFQVIFVLASCFLMRRHEDRLLKLRDEVCFSADNDSVLLKGVH